MSDLQARKPAINALIQQNPEPMIFAGTGIIVSFYSDLSSSEEKDFFMFKKAVLLGFIFVIMLGCKRQDNQPDSERYIVVSPEVAEIIAALDKSDKIVALTAECDFPKELNKIEKIGSFGKINFERILELQPTIVFTSGLEQESLANDLKKLSIPVAKIYPQSLTEMIKSIIEIGELVDSESEAKELADKLEFEIAALKNESTKNKPKIYVEIYGDPIMSVNSTSFVGELVDIAGGHNVFSDLPREYSRVNAEILINSDPEIILLTYPGVTAVDIMNRKGWQSIQAVRDKKIFTVEDIDPDLILRASPRCIEGIKALKKAFHE